MAGLGTAVQAQVLELEPQTQLPPALNLAVLFPYASRACGILLTQRYTGLISGEGSLPNPFRLARPIARGSKYVYC